MHHPLNPSQAARRRLLGALTLAPLLRSGPAVGGTATYDFTIIRAFGISDLTFQSPLILGQDGYFYGNLGSYLGSANVCRIATDGSLDIVAPIPDYGYAYVDRGLMQTPDGGLYGASTEGGGGAGFIYTVNPDGSGYAQLHAFALDITGGYPSHPPALGPDGCLYGSTDLGGQYGAGVFYRMALDGSGYQVIHHVRNDGTDGSRPGGLTLAGDGCFYGITRYGGAMGYGTVFRLCPDGTLTNLHQFDSIGGGFVNQVTLHPNGSMYFTVTRGHLSDHAQPRGAAYQLSTNGTLRELALFKAQHGGFFPCSAMVVGMDGQLYGTTEKGGAHGYGVLYKLNVQGNLRTIHDFQRAPDNGESPYEGVVLGADGSLYGTTDAAGPQGYGIFYRVHKTL
jgi:uncharacterized repeat protein (TIGR03803 family)